LETQQTTLKAIIRKAREEGDIDTETEANQRLTDLTMEQRQVAGWLQSQGEQVQAYKQPQNYQQQVQQQQYQAPAQPQRAAPSPQAEDWAERNPWFGQDKMLTYAAWGIHETLVSEEGVDPNSSEYYTELDRRLVEEFPNKFQRSSSAQPIRQQRSAPAVAPAARSSGINNVRRTVRLSPSQVAIAKKLGVPIEEYAKYVKE
jgi:pyruvate/2-oxoglutarate dehydrogenase complex dihydrolipoamide acyltransferase (E2) component